MRSTVLWALVALNVLLFAALVGRVSTPNAAFAQNRQPAAPAAEAGRPARPGDYLLVPGEVTGGPTSVVYIVDMANGLLGAMAYDDTRNQLQSMPGRIDLQQVFSQANARPANADDRRRGN